MDEQKIINEVMKNKDLTTETNKGTEFKLGRSKMHDMAVAIRNPGFEYLGGISLLIYRSTFSQEAQFQVVSCLEDIHEGIANKGVQELAKHAMRVYGHEPPKKRGDK